MIINYDQLIEDVGLFGQVHYYTLRSNPAIIYVSSNKIEDFSIDVWNDKIVSLAELIIKVIDPTNKLSRREKIIYAYMKAKRITKITLAALLAISPLELTNLISDPKLSKTKKFKQLEDILGIDEEVLIH